MVIRSGAEIKSQLSGGMVELNRLKIEIVSGFEHVHCFGHQQLGHGTRGAVRASRNERVKMAVHVEIGENNLKKNKVMRTLAEKKTIFISLSLMMLYLRQTC